MVHAGPLPMARPGSQDNYILRGQYGRYPSWPAQHGDNKIPRTQSSKSVPENAPTTPQSAPAAMHGSQNQRKYLCQN